MKLLYLIFFIILGFSFCQFFLYIYNKICYNIIDWLIAHGNKRIQK
jgi:hypothetical protein